MVARKPDMSGTSAYEPAGTGHVRRARSAFTIRLWAVRHARFLEFIYDAFASVLLTLHPLWKAIGYHRVEKPVVVIESMVKSFLFDCRMCGQCALGDSGMSCPMNCPKGIRNGPCGGVRADGNCEVEADMPCVWVEAWSGSQQMKKKDNILNLQTAIDHSLRGSSSWLRATADKARAQEDSS
ncbi:MAG: methylenetetrahydrofolate reductase [Alphaproteobacteria bacterium]|nr:methylenetetrahydrofolate reductase [Alphaproteobacteria bacterium]MBT4084747.1 methylenetetrahydrofolate reductase [Alphaproteobacteria bacterium]MBT4544703.1 methylenetetrahydrofolate reductase [Alphaproteobacteria bacterium]MBT7745919.1 methylenetetrahydrofolate reductase [Alphaproteobacteria bacterium]